MLRFEYGVFDQLHAFVALVAPLQAVDLVGVILLIGVVSAYAARIFRVPMLIPLLLTGMALGPFGLNLIQPENFGLTLSDIALFVIPLFLFGESVNTDIRGFRAVRNSVVLLSTAGVLVTAFGVMLITGFIFGIPLRVAFVLGAILSSTDSAAVMSILGGVKRNVSTALRLEAATNDPTSIVLFTVGLQMLSGVGFSLGDAVTQFVRLFAGGAIVGLAFGFSSTAVIQRFEIRERLSYISLIVFVVTYSASEYLGVSGIMASVVCGLVFGRELRHSRPATRELYELSSFWDNVSFLAQIAIFLLLGLYASRSALLGGDALLGALVALLLIVVIRPAAVFMCTAVDRLSFREKLFISWVGARGAVPAALVAIYVGLAQGSAYLSAYSSVVSSIVLFIVITSVLITGLTTGRVANALGVAERHTAPETEVLYAKRVALKEALAKLEREKSSGSVPEGVYSRLSGELLQALSTLDERIAESRRESPPVERTQLDELYVRQELVRTQMDSLLRLLRDGEIAPEVYEATLRELRRELARTQQEIEESGG